MKCSKCEQETNQGDYYCKDCRANYNSIYQLRLMQNDYQTKRKAKYYSRKYGLKNGDEVRMISCGRIAKYENGEFFFNGNKIRNKKGFNKLN